MKTIKGKLINIEIDPDYVLDNGGYLLSKCSNILCKITNNNINNFILIIWDINRINKEKIPKELFFKICEETNNPGIRLPKLSFFKNLSDVLKKEAKYSYKNSLKEEIKLINSHSYITSNIDKAKDYYVMSEDEIISYIDQLLLMKEIIE